MQQSQLSRERDTQADLKDLIVESIQDKKGEKIVSLDLRQIPDAITDYFVICEASSTTQVKAIADHVAENVKAKTGERPWHVEGYENLEWILVDYVNVVVHVFHREKRAFYQLEDLWSDAIITEYEDDF